MTFDACVSPSAGGDPVAPSGSLERPRPSPDGEAVWLEPLRARHAAPYRTLFHGDPYLARLVALPRLRDRRATAAWIRKGARDYGFEPFAVVHEARGFVGAAALVGHGGIGNFWFWIGAEHRGRGFGSRALEHLEHTARERHGLDGLVAFVRAVNLPSRRTLQRRGFRDTGLPLLPRRNSILAYADPSLFGRPDLPAAIAAMLAAVDSPIGLADEGASAVEVPR